MLAVTATAREAEDLTDGSELAAACATAVAYFPAWETLPHERLSPRSDTCGRRLAVLRRLAHPEPGRPADRAAQRGGHARSAACCSRSSPGSATSRRSACAPARRPTSTTVLDQAGRDRLHPDRPGGAARRDRGARRHRRRVPAHRGASAAGRVLRRRGRGDPSVQGRRPAQPRHRRDAAVGAAVPRAAADPGGPGAGQAARRRPPGPGRRARQARRRASPSRAWRRSRPPSPTGWSCCSTTCPPAAVVLACDPERIRARAADLVRTSQEFLEASWVNAAAGGAGADRPGRRRVPADHRGPRPPPAAWACPGGRSPRSTSRRRAGAGDQPGGEPDGQAGGQARRSASGLRPAERPTAATPTRVLADVRRWLAGRLAGRAGHARGTARPSGWPRCCAATGSAPGSATWTSRRSLACPAWRPGCIEPGLHLAGGPAGRAAPRRTWPGQRTGSQGHAPDAQPAARRRSTRCSSRPATTSCTSSTASAGTWR